MHCWSQDQNPGAKFSLTWQGCDLPPGAPDRLPAAYLLLRVLTWDPAQPSGQQAAHATSPPGSARASLVSLEIDRSGQCPATNLGAV